MSMENNQSQRGSAIPRTQVRRLPHLAVQDREQMLAVLHAGKIAHVGIVDADEPRVLPMAYAPAGDSSLLLHGSTASQLSRRMATGASVCVTVTLLDGLVVSNSSFEASMNYRCVMVFGHGTEVPATDKLEALRTLSEHLFPHRWPEFIAPTDQQLKATCLIRIPLDEMSMKTRTGPALDSPEDHSVQRWSGVVPMQMTFGEPIADPHVQVPAPEYINRWLP
ncbi:MAG: pyridoxamine 5'-phosphate oxidase family protein [Actinobacteria bacterium]|nr:pyridoxamine 5'-phosphate oxidase family protein [Actinomycetota bacterium]